MLCFFNLYGKDKKEDSIDYDHRLISKEIKRTFKTDGYNLKMLNPADSSGLSTHSKGNYFTISNHVSQLGYCYIGRVNSCRAGGCSISSSETNNVDLDYEYFDYIVIFDSSYIVKGLRVFNYQATHGHEICSRNWLKQYVGFDGNRQLKVGKDIDAISGATISVYAITIEIERVTFNLRKTMSLSVK